MCFHVRLLGALMLWFRVKQNYFKIISAFVDAPTEIILAKIIQNDFRGLLWLVNIFQHVQCR